MALAATCAHVRKGERPDYVPHMVAATAFESEHQKEVARYLRFGRIDAPLFTAPSNGIESSSKAKHKAKQMGMECGVPDLLIFEPRPPYVGLAIELKRCRSGRPSPAQRQWIERLRRRGWYACVEVGAYSAISRIRDYLGAVKLPAEPLCIDSASSSLAQETRD
jgi:hypothetical protein